MKTETTLVDELEDDQFVCKGCNTISSHLGKKGYCLECHNDELERRSDAEKEERLLCR